MRVHAYPIGDCREHDLQSGDCWCKPEIESFCSTFVLVQVLSSACDSRTLTTDEFAAYQPLRGVDTDARRLRGWIIPRLSSNEIMEQ